MMENWVVCSLLHRLANFQIIIWLIRFIDLKWNLNKEILHTNGNGVTIQMQKRKEVSWETLNNSTQYFDNLERCHFQWEKISIFLWSFLHLPLPTKWFALSFRKFLGNMVKWPPSQMALWVFSIHCKNAWKSVTYAKRTHKIFANCINSPHSAFDLTLHDGTKACKICNTIQ